MLEGCWGLIPGGRFVAWVQAWCRSTHAEFSGFTLPAAAMNNPAEEKQLTDLLWAAAPQDFIQLDGTVSQLEKNGTRCDVAGWRAESPMG